jgi:hypothetical protein
LSDKRNAYKVLVGKREGMILLQCIWGGGRLFYSQCIWENNIKMDNKIVWKDMVWIHLAQDKDSQHALVNVAMNRPHKMVGISWPNKRLLDSDGLCSMKLVTPTWHQDGEDKCIQVIFSSKMWGYYNTIYNYFFLSTRWFNFYKPCKAKLQKLPYEKRIESYQTTWICELWYTGSFYPANSYVPGVSA